MWNASIKFAAVLSLALNLHALEASAEPRDPKTTVQELAGLTADMGHFATILRLSEDIAFWQGVAIMGAQYDWEFDYKKQEKLEFAWTYRLTNSLYQSKTEGIQASLAIARSRVLTDEEKQAGSDLFSDYERMRVLGEEVNRLLREDNIAAASALFESDVLQLRRDISGRAASSAIRLHDRVKRIALDIRLGK